MKRSFLIHCFLPGAVAMGLLFLLPEGAAAHLVTTGMGPVYDGMGHLFLSPEDLVVALAVALYAGMRGASHGRYVLFLLPAAWVVGGNIGMQAGAIPAMPAAAFFFLFVGLLIAADFHLSEKVFGTVAVLIGLVHGFYNGIALKAGSAVPALLGIAVALFILLALVSAGIVLIRAPWARIAVRVMGSWVAAIGVLMAGWFVRGPMI